MKHFMEYARHQDIHSIEVPEVPVRSWKRFWLSLLAVGLFMGLTSGLTFGLLVGLTFGSLQPHFISMAFAEV